MSQRSIDLWVGLFVAMGLAALLFLALKVGNLLKFNDEARGYLIEARFDNIGNLKVRAPVRSAGVVVGRVESISLDDKTFEAVVRLRIDHRYQFSRDTIAAIYTSGLLGEQFVGLEPGGDPAVLKDGERLRKTQSAMQLEKLVSQFLFNKAQEGPSAAATAPAAGAKP
ncbi:MAG: outer membrane lipid asymmetry maintenance protein MlaD [Casimicrobiaceae bacterium]|nr:outer membrane lipid asymmetry maintenance protein MlaD [Casimicrobiaceae bacterium]MCX8098430.1 outer membrane lipid asymmetry maintenance protein MlaD [Casimicrobiaceae bacterium]MDW8311142.1 outer membrane lipid asymmetry maintenance protein MlaD [Burkholderiales bacterium]